MTSRTIKKLSISENASIKEAMRTIDEGQIGTAFVVDSENKLIGLIRDGDIRGAIFGGMDIKSS
ncbi:CBS domain-containing protein, partial [Candidatus Margulisiibacteriota bacterium]